MPPRFGRPGLLRVVEDDAGGVAPAGTDPTDAVAKSDAVVASRAPDRPAVHGEGDGIALPERHDLRSRLHARALLGQHELAAGEVPARPGEPDRDLPREIGRAHG